MGNGRERSKREMFMEEKEQLHYPEWIDALKEEEDYFPSKVYQTKLLVRGFVNFKRVKERGKKINSLKNTHLLIKNINKHFYLSNKILRKIITII